MADFVAEQVATSRIQPDDRAAAARYLIRTGNTDVLEVLGLVDPPASAKRTRTRKEAAA
jgi:hypothetical protein